MLASVIHSRATVRPTYLQLEFRTIWIRLGTADSKINDRLSVFFYSVAFLAFVSVPISSLWTSIADYTGFGCTLQMSVAGIPSCKSSTANSRDAYADVYFKVLEERAVFQRESKNGLYTTLPFVLANTLVNLPFLFLCTLFFTVVCYWAIVSAVSCFPSPFPG